MISIYEAFHRAGGTAVPGTGEAVWGCIKDALGLQDDEAEDAAAESAGYYRQRGPDGDYFVPLEAE